MKRSLLFGLIFLDLILFVSNKTTVAQEDRFSIADLTPYLINQEWASNSTAFIFQNPSVDSETWFKVEMNTHRITESKRYPLSPVLSNLEAQIFQTRDAIRVSPDGKLLLYATEAPEYTNVTEGEIRNFWYTLANRNTQQKVTTTLAAANEVNVGELISVEWSADSSSVAINALTEAGTRRIDYISIPDVSNLKDMMSTSFNLEVEGRQFYTSDPLMNRLMDVRSDGKLVLLTAQEDDPNIDPYSEPTFLVLWNPVTPEISQLIQIAGVDFALTKAVFSPQSENQLLLWQFEAIGAQSGTLYTYDLTSHTLRPLVSIDQLYNPIFSPDAEWFSYSTGDELVFLKVRDILLGTPSALPSG